MAESITLDGTLERVVFQNRDSQWTVARFAPDEGGDEVTVVGSLLGVPPGTPLTVRGGWVVDKRYGKQFRIESYRTKSPETLIGIERYLGSGLVPGIGPELAKRIVGHFGQDTLAVIEKEPERLHEVEGIGQSRASKIAGAWVEQKDIQDVMVFLRGHGVSTAYAVRIYKKYGGDAVGLVRQNPYRLALDIWGIGFRTADAIARSLGIGKDAPERLESGLVHVLGELASDGHVHVPEEHLLESAAELLEVEATELAAPLDKLVASNLAVREPLGDRGLCISLIDLWEEEHEAAQAFSALVNTPMRRAEKAAIAALAAFEGEAGIELAPQQRQAIEASVTDKCVVITGGPGVGKTTIVRAIVRIFAARERRFALAAPTGRAAKRLAESTRTDAGTIHRLLEFQPQDSSFARNAQRPLQVDAIIVDEVSMMDIALFRALLTATPPEAQVILVGDVDQLPSVGPGSVLADVIASGAASVVRLTEIFRQAAASKIVVNAHRVNRGEPPELAPPPGRDADRSDFYFVSRDDPTLARQLIVELVAERIPQSFGLDPLADIQVLTPMHRGELGTRALNAALQERLNPGGPGVAEMRRGERPFRAGDKVMQIRNDYDKSVFNGDIGIIRDVRRPLTDDGDNSLAVEMLDGRAVDYQRDELDQLVHAFAISVHKSQGSEYPAVVIPLATQHYLMLQRNLLYTAITRGKRLVVIVGMQKAVNMAVRNDATRVRWTWLAERIREATA